MVGRKRADVTSTTLAAELARRLRALRDESHLTLRQLAGKSGFAASTLSVTESGRAVPSWDLVAAFVQSCGQDPAGWRQLWEVARAQAAAPASETAANLPAVEADAAAAAAVSRPEPAAVAVEGMTNRAGHRRVAIIAGTSGLAAAMLATAIVAFSLAGNARSPAAAAAGTPGATPAGDSTDPYAGGCKADEKQLDWQPVRRAGHTTFGTVILMYSPACRAAWGYLDGPNSTAWTTHIIAHRIPGNATAPSQFTGNADYGSWGNVLSTRSGCVYIEAYVTDRDGQGPHARTACVQP